MTNEMKHTPGPWQIFDDGMEYAGIAHHPMGDETDDMRHTKLICNFDGCHNKKANARLIAAAPEMLEALKLAENNLHDDTAEWVVDAVKLAIIHATGKAE